MNDIIPNLISHKDSTKNFKETYVEAKNRIIEKSGSQDNSLQLQLDLLDQLSEFPFGRFLLEHKGWNGYWTHYAIMHQFKGRITGNDNDGNPFLPLEDFILNKAPIILATQQRFLHFKECLQKRLENNSTHASLPCGLMDDLLTLDFSNKKNIKLVGIDLDLDSLKKAADYTERLDVTPEVEFLHINAWNLEMENEFDSITSNGLNIYEPDDSKVEKLYKIFYKALKQKGQLITSNITPPPIDVNAKSEWKMEEINEKDLLLQKILFVDVIGVKWSSTRTVVQSKLLLKNAGFKNINVLYDKTHMFPTFTAEKNIV